MTRRSGIHWYYDTLTPSLRLFPAAVNKMIEERMDEAAADIEDYMKANAPWDDQTGDARDGLGAEAHTEGFHHYIELFHSVDYGIWLEVKWSGQWAIIVPTMEAMGPHVVANLNGLI